MSITDPYDYLSRKRVIRTCIERNSKTESFKQIMSMLDGDLLRVLMYRTSLKNKGKPLSNNIWNMFDESQVLAEAEKYKDLSDHQLKLESFKRYTAYLASKIDSDQEYYMDELRKHPDIEKYESVWELIDEIV